MIRIAICCGGGFSSSALASRMAKELKESGRDNEYSIIFRPIRELIRNHDDIDIAFLCPHLLHSAKRWLDEEPVNFPVYMIPTRIYGLMTLETVLEDAEDIIKIFNEKHENFAHFPNEDNPLLNKRIKSYRRTYNVTF